MTICKKVQSFKYWLISFMNKVYYQVFTYLHVHELVYDNTV